jgi:hypothetical protein
MRYVIDCQETISGDLDSVWATWTDLPSYTSWDPREEEMRVDTSFGVGATGFSKQRGGRPGSVFRVVRVEPKTRWVNEVPLPGGTLTIDHVLTEVGLRKTHVLKRYVVEGPMAIAFRLVFAKGIRKDAPGTFAALENEVRRRSESAARSK